MLTTKMKTKSKPKYPPTPELDKMKAVKFEGQVIGQFLDWLTNDKHREICEMLERNCRADYVPVGKSIEQTLAEYFEIDLRKIEKERRAVLEYVREIND